MNLCEWLCLAAPLLLCGTLFFATGFRRPSRRQPRWPAAYVVLGAWFIVTAVTGNFISVASTYIVLLALGIVDVFRRSR